MSDSKKETKESKKTRREAGRSGGARRALLIAGIVILALLLLVLLAAGVMFFRYYGMLNTKTDPADSSIHYDDSALLGLDSTPPTAAPDDPDNPYNPENPNSPLYTGPAVTLPPEAPADSTKAPDTTEPQSPETSGSSTTPVTTAPATQPAPTPAADIVAEKGIVNILLIGADYETRYGNSDAMIVVSINNVDHRITLTSILRDTAAYFPVVRNGETEIWRDKISNAHAYGGPQLLIAAIEMNFGIKISNYAEVHYEEFLKVFEAIGGLDIVMDAEEVESFNFECGGRKIPEDSAGKPVHLDAEQVLSYARMRHLSGSDFGRTKRHRNVLIAAFNKVKTFSIGEIDELLTTLLPIIETDLTMGDCLGYASAAASYAKYNVETFRIPLDGYYTYEDNDIAIRGYNMTHTINAWKEQVAG